MTEQKSDAEWLRDLAVLARNRGTFKFYLPVHEIAERLEKIADDVERHESLMVRAAKKGLLRI